MNLYKLLCMIEEFDSPLYVGWYWIDLFPFPRVCLFI